MTFTNHVLYVPKGTVAKYVWQLLSVLTPEERLQYGINAQRKRERGLREYANHRLSKPDCPRGHPYIWATQGGREVRICRICHRLDDAKRRGKEI